MANVCKTYVLLRFASSCCKQLSLFFLPSHVPRSVSPTTTSQIQARKKRRGVSSVLCRRTSSPRDSGRSPKAPPPEPPPAKGRREFMQSCGFKQGWGWGEEGGFTPHS